MTWIKTIDPADADGRLKEIYNSIEAKRGKVANVMKAQSLNPRALQLHLELYDTLMFGKSGLSREEIEIIAVIISHANKCGYCIVHHGEALNQYWQDDNRLIALVENYQNAGLSDKVKAMLEYASKLTRTPSKVIEADIEELRKNGLLDEDILDLNLIVSYMNFANRIINGLGVRFDTTEVKGYKY